MISAYRLNILWCFNSKSHHNRHRTCASFNICKIFCYILMKIGCSPCQHPSVKHNKQILLQLLQALGSSPLEVKQAISETQQYSLLSFVFLNRSVIRFALRMGKSGINHAINATFYTLFCKFF